MKGISFYKIYKNHILWLSISSYSPHLIICVFSKLPSSPSQPHQRSSETHFQTTFFHLAKPKIPATISQNVVWTSKLPIFQQLLRGKPCPVSARPPIPAPYRRTRPAVFWAEQSWCRPQNFRRALSTSCSLHSNAKGRLKNPLRNFSDGLSFGHRLSNQSSPTSIVFSL